MNVSLDEFKEGLAKAKREKERERKKRETDEYYAYWRCKAARLCRAKLHRKKSGFK